MNLSKKIIEKRKHVLNNDPNIWTVDNFLKEDECKHMIDLGKLDLTRSKVCDKKKSVISQRRTSQTSWIDHNKDEISKKIAEKISRYVNIPIQHAEKFQLAYYKKTQQYFYHFDSWDNNGSEKTLNAIKYGGPRILTAIVYLNDVKEGGCTEFSKLNLKVKPERGKLLVFQNTCKNLIDKHPLSEHAGNSVIKGEKYILTLWFRHCERSKLYKEFNPSYYENIHLDKDKII